MKCKRCNKNELKKPLERNALSKDNKTYICKECEEKETSEELSNFLGMDIQF